MICGDTRCMNQNVHSKDAILSVVYKSLSGEAGRVIMLLEKMLNYHRA